MEGEGRIIGAAILFVSLIMISGMAGLIYLRFREMDYESTHLYLIDIERTAQEENWTSYITRAEDIDYSILFNESQRDSGKMMMFKDAEPRANFISRENIDHYSTHIEDLRHNKTYGHYKMDYHATAEKVDNITLKLISRRDPDESKRTGIYYNGRYVNFFPGTVSHIIYHNGSTLIETQWDYPYYKDESEEYYYEDCYIIEMKLEYSAKPEPDEGGGFEMSQIVILDMEGDLKFLYNYRLDIGVLIDEIDTPWN